MRVLYIVNCSNFFCSHFLQLALKVKGAGHVVGVAAGNDIQKAVIQQYGFEFFDIQLSRSGKNIFYELISIGSIITLYKNFRPELVHMFTIKPILYGCFADRLMPSLAIKKLVASITGLGSASLSTSFMGQFLWRIIKYSYKFLLCSNKTNVIFENVDDRSFFIDNNIVTEINSRIVNGAGVDIELFSPSNEKHKTVTVVFVARLLKDKGVREYIEAGQILKNKGIDINMLLVGPVDIGNPSSMSEEEIFEAHSNGYITYLGQRNDVASIYKHSHIACLPSYREGLPKSLIEAAASGLAIVTTDVPGCRQMILKAPEEINGVLVKVKSAKDLSSALEFLCQDRELINRMGHSSRILAEAKFSHNKVNASFFDIYNF